MCIRVSWRWKATNYIVQMIAWNQKWVPHSFWSLVTLVKCGQNHAQACLPTLHSTRYFSRTTILLSHTMPSVILVVLLHCDVPKRIEVGKWQCSSLGHSHLNLVFLINGWMTMFMFVCIYSIRAIQGIPFSLYTQNWHWKHYTMNFIQFVLAGTTLDCSWTSHIPHWTASSKTTQINQI